MSRWTLKDLLRTEWEHLITINETDRAWQMPIAAALSSGLPLLIGAWFDHLNYGLVSSLGGMIFLYLPSTPMAYRMMFVMAAAFGMVGCYTLGLMSHFFPWTIFPMVIFITSFVTIACRTYGVGMPGNTFFVMAAAIGAYSRIQVEQIPMMVGLLAMGSLLAILIGLFYSLIILRTHPPKPIPVLPPPSFDVMVFEPVIIGVFAGMSLMIAQALDFQKPYWVPVSCVAVMAAASLRAKWNKQLHRILGSCVGLLVAWGIFLLPLDKWSVCLVMMLLAFITELIVVRHYGAAIVFITPSAILLAEASTLGEGSVWPMIQARFFDTVLGCVIGFIGGACLHSPKFRDIVGRPMRYLIPLRFGPH